MSRARGQRGPGPAEQDAARAKVLLYDGDCSLCTWVARGASRRLGPGVTVLAAQRADLVRLGVSRDQAEHEVVWIDEQGPVGGVTAFARALTETGRWGRLLGRLLSVPLVNGVAAGVYRVVAANRSAQRRRRGGVRGRLRR